MFSKRLVPMCFLLCILIQLNFVESCSSRSPSSNTTPASTTTKVILQTCAPLDCKYNQLQDTATCACTCLPGFMGALCENFDCSSTLEDAPECVVLTCSDSSEISSCPRQCGVPCAK